MIGAMLRIFRRIRGLRLIKPSLHLSFKAPLLLRHKAMSYKRMAEQERSLEAEVKAWLDQAQAADAAEDAQHGADHRGDETPAWMADKQRRLERIRAAKAQLEAEARAGADSGDADGPGPSSGMQERGARKSHSADEEQTATPPDRAQRNFTDGDSRIMPSGGGFIAGYNGQIAVDAAHQIIIAEQLSTNPADFAALIPLVDQAHANLGRKLREVSGDTGFATEANLAAMKKRGIRAYLTPGRIRHGETDPTAGRVLKRKPLMQAMADKIRRAGRRSRYRLRKQTAEPVFGQIKQPRGFRQFLLRGLNQVRGEWAMICTAHNILKLHKATA
ncbi:MAG: transposase, partial [Alphaproteobacteria bacterium]